MNTEEYLSAMDINKLKENIELKIPVLSDVTFKIG